jgi:hypothetical protein
LRNWFKRAQYIGEFSIVDGVLQRQYSTGTAFDTMQVSDGQYFRIINSTFNDGVHKVGDVLDDEVFIGAVWSMGIPKAVIDIANEIDDWQQKYGGTDSQLLSPYSSESFGGYSYTKAGDGSSGGGASWKSVFGSRLSAWRKI